MKSNYNCPWGFEIPAKGNFNVTAILAHSSIVGEEDELFVLDSNFQGKFKEQISILYQFAKFQGKFSTWHDCLVDLDYCKTGQIMVLLKWFSSPISWNREVNYCIPNEGITV